jgi:hypothetical protein
LRREISLTLAHASRSVRLWRSAIVGAIGDQDSAAFERGDQIGGAPAVMRAAFDELEVSASSELFFDVDGVLVHANGRRTDHLQIAVVRF